MGAEVRQDSAKKASRTPKSEKHRESPSGLSLSGRLLGALEAVLEALGGLLEASEGVLEALGAVLRPSWKVLDASCAKSSHFVDFVPAFNGQTPARITFLANGLRFQRALSRGVGGVGGPGLDSS